jgi:hypothetical protein
MLMLDIRVVQPLPLYGRAICVIIVIVLILVWN